MQKKVFTAMAIVGLLLTGYTLKLHEHVLPASEEQAHHACRQICQLGLLSAAGAESASPLAAVTAMIARSACETMDDSLQVLADCRERMGARGLTVATWRCLASIDPSASDAIASAKACDASLF
ncbi:MAG: hypothetical protein VYE15_07485 [Myxococcota bacterium]|nr:hypothetical protein [Myxococcota bacterium]